MKNYIFVYWAAIESGQAVVGKWVRLIFAFLVDGLKSGKWDFDEKKANKAIDFIQSFCHHSEGRNDLLTLELWQKAIVCAIFGIIDKSTGYRQFREVFIVVARKNGKTLFAAAIAAYMAFIDGEYGAKIYFLAPKLDQADLVYDAFYQITQSDETLMAWSKKRQRDIYIKDLNTSIKKIAFNSKKSDGFNPHMVTNDEMEAWEGQKGIDQYEVMASAVGARTQPILLSISTAGKVNDGIYDELMRRSTSVLKGNSGEKRLLPFIYMIDDLEKWDDLEELKKSNPNLGISVQPSFYEEQIAIARGSLPKKAEFLMKYCNIKQNNSVAWLDYMDVQRATNDHHLILEEFKGCYCVAGIDLSSTTDLTAVSLVIYKNGKNHVITKFYMCKNRFEVAADEDKVPYAIHRERGFLEISGEGKVDYKDVYKFFIDLVKVYKIRPLKVGYDRWMASNLVEELAQSGFNVDSVKQGPNLTPILRDFEGDLKEGKYDIGDNGLLASHLLNVAVDISLSDGRMTPKKLESRLRIDGAVSLFDALTVKDKYYAEIGKKLLNIKKEEGKKAG